MKTITRDELKKRMDNEEDLTIIEVLEPQYFKKFHLPHAINIPVNGDFKQQIQQAVPNKDQPVVVYCANTECPASDKAAQQMDLLGYTEVYDYTQGKEDWQNAGFPTES